MKSLFSYGCMRFVSLSCLGAPGAAFAADFDGGQLATLHEIVDRWDWNAKILGGFLDGHEVVSGRRR